MSKAVILAIKTSPIIRKSQKGGDITETVRQYVKIGCTHKQWCWYRGRGCPLPPEVPTHPMTPAHLEFQPGPKLQKGIHVPICFSSDKTILPIILITGSGCNKLFQRVKVFELSLLRQLPCPRFPSPAPTDRHRYSQLTTLWTGQSHTEMWNSR